MLQHRSQYCHSPKAEVNDLTFTKKGKIYIPNPNDASKLQITYDDWGDTRNLEYWIYDTDYTSYAVVGNNLDMIWILSREATMSFCVLEKILDLLDAKGFNTDRGLTLGIKMQYITKCGK